MTIVRACLGVLQVTLVISGPAAGRQIEIRPGEAGLDPRRLGLGTDTVHLSWEIDGERRPGPRQIEELAVEWSGGHKRLRHVMTVENASGRALSDTTWYEFDSLVPVVHRSHAAQRTLVLRYDGARGVEGFKRTADGLRTPIALSFDGAVFDPSASILAVRSLSLEADLDVRIPLLDHETRTVRWSRARVIGLEPVDVNGASVMAWRIAVRISDDRPNVTYWISHVDQRLVRVEAPLGGGRVMHGTVSAVSAADVGIVIDRGITALGGEAALWAVRSLSVSEIGHQYLIEQSERPAGPFIGLYQERESLIDLQHVRLRTTERNRFVQFPEWTPARTTVADTGAAAAVRGERQTAAQPANVLEAAWTLELDPLRVFFTAREAPDARIVADTVLQDVPHLVMSFTWRARPVRVFINAHTSLPTAVAVRAPELHGHGSVWGDALVSQWFSTWSLEAGGIRFPRQRDVYFEHYPWKSFTATRVTFNVEMPADSFALTPATRHAFATASGPGGLRDMRLGTLFGGREVEPIDLPGGVVVLPGAWYATLVPMDSGLMVLEAPISPEYSAQVMDEARRRFPDREIIAAVSTSDAWPHVGGVREYVARGIPVYVVDVNLPLLERLVRRPWTAAPDALERHPRAAEFRAVSGKTTLGDGDQAIELYPIRTESGERMLMAYWPAHRVLYAADLIQRQGDGSFFWPLYLREVADAVDREGLVVETVFAMHLEPAPWSTVLEAIR